MDTFVLWWQTLPSKMNPNIVSIGDSFQIKWYGLMYVIAAIITYVLANYRIKNEDRFKGYTREDIENAVFYGILGVMLGGRLGYVLFYNLPHYLNNPIEIFWPLRDGKFVGLSGMSYHGGVIGVILMLLLFCRNNQKNFWHLADLFCPAVPLGYTFGRLGNFINGELYGRVTTSVIGMNFSKSTGPDDPIILRHPSQLYEAFFEGVVLFSLLWIFRKRIKRPMGSMLTYYIFGYGFVRFCIEYFRQPDDHLGFVFLQFSMGQLLCFAMMLGAILLFFFLRWRESKLTPEQLDAFVPGSKTENENNKWKKRKKKKH